MNLLPVISVFLLLVAALLAVPYGYYQLLRLVVCMSAAMLCARYHERNKTALFTMFLLAALLFNPVFKVHLEPETWKIVDLIAAGLFIVPLVKSPNNY